MPACGRQWSLAAPSHSSEKISLAWSRIVGLGSKQRERQDAWDDVLKPVVARYQGKVTRIYFRADAAFAVPEVYEFLEAERIKYAIRLPANQVLQGRIGYLLKRPVGRPSNELPWALRTRMHETR
jgi:Transposase DDE domain group 1